MRKSKKLLMLVVCLFFLPTMHVAAKTNKQVPGSRFVESVVKKRFAEAPILVRIAKCESSFRQYDEDGSVLKGTVDKRDTGVMQINRRYHGSVARKLGLDLDMLTDNLTYAQILYEEEGTRPWKASERCWSRS